MEAATTLALAEHENITAVKEASGNLAQIAEIIRGRPQNFTVLSGDDGLTLAVMAEGGDGVISVTSNAVPSSTSGGSIIALIDAALIDYADEGLLAIDRARDQAAVQCDGHIYQWSDCGCQRCGCFVVISAGDCEH